MSLHFASPITYNDCRRLSREDEIATWERWQAGSIEARDLLIESVIPWAYELAKRLARRYKLDADECRAIAAAELVQAVGGYDARRSRLTTWVTSPITWALLDYSKVATVPISRPANLPKTPAAQKRWKAVRRGASLGIRTNLRAMEPRRHDKPWTAEGVTPEQFATAVAGLPIKLRHVIRHHLDGRLDREIGVDFGCSGQWVRKLRLQAICKLREHFIPADTEAAKQ